MEWSVVPLSLLKVMILCLSAVFRTIVCLHRPKGTCCGAFIRRILNMINFFMDIYFFVELMIINEIAVSVIKHRLFVRSECFMVFFRYLQSTNVICIVVGIEVRPRPHHSQQKVKDLLEHQAAQFGPGPKIVNF